MIWLLLVAGVALLPVVLLLSGRRASRAAVKNWDVFLSPRAQEAYLTVAETTRAELELSDVAFEGAAQAAAAGARIRSLQLLDMGCDLIEHYCPTMLRALRAMAVLSRMIAAITPVPALRPRDFRLAELSQLAQLHVFLNQFLVGAGERFRLRLLILGRGFRLLGRLMLRSAARIRGQEQDSGSEWERLALARADMRSLTEQSLHSLRALVEAIETSSRQDQRLP